MSDTQSKIDRKPLVNFRVEQSQKEKWEGYVEGSNLYTSLSDLIRKAVEKEINSEQREPPTEGQMVGELQSELGSISEELEQLQKDVSWLRSREEHDVEQLAHQIFNSIEAVKASGDDESAAQMGTIAGGKPHTVKSLADQLNTTPARVEEAIEYLKQQHMPIIRFDIEDETHWFKEE